MKASHAPPSGSSPIQHGHSTPHEQASSSVPWRSYTTSEAWSFSSVIAMCITPFVSSAIGGVMLARSVAAPLQPDCNRAPIGSARRRRCTLRARYPERDGYVERDGVKTFYEVFAGGDPTVLLLPAWSIVHSRIWKMQVPYLARHYRVIAFDGRGNGRSDRPPAASDYADAEYVADALAVMDDTDTERAVI